mgnify:CR=1 FL=1
MNTTDRLIKLLIALAFAAASAALWWPVESHAERIKEVATIQGVRPNQLVGYGLVVGLDGTGDQTTQTPFTTQSLNAMLQQLGINVPAGTTMQPKNVAAVLVTASLPPFAQPGQAMDVNVSSLGNAKSLRGGTLIATPLKGADGQIYGLAQGNLIVGGAGASQGGSKVQVNHLSAGRIPAGATVERSVPTPWMQSAVAQLDIQADDFNTARDVADAIRQGIVLCPEDRKEEGIIGCRSVSENINISCRRNQRRFGLFVNDKQEAKTADHYITRLRIKTPNREQPIRLLSGGNQQKAILARWLAEDDMRVLIIDEPTRGIDVGAKNEIYQVLYELAERGVAVLMISSELPEILGVADRVLVMSEGRIAGELPREQANEQAVLKLALRPESAPSPSLAA